MSEIRLAGEPDIKGMDVSTPTSEAPAPIVEPIYFSAERVFIGREDSGIYDAADIARMRAQGIDVESIGFGVALFQRLRLSNPNRVDI